MLAITILASMGTVCESLGTHWQTFQQEFQATVKNLPPSLAQTVKSLPAYLAKVDQVVGCILGVVAYGLVCTLQPAAEKTASFVKKNWQQLIGYIVAWGVVVICTGLLYGFQAVALPLTIGLGGGIAFGCIAAILSLNSYDPKGCRTPWNLLNRGIQGLDQNGTRQIVLAVSVTVLLAAAVVYPYVMGALFGIFIAWQVTAKIGTEQDLGPNPKNAHLQQQLHTLREDLQQAQAKFNQLEQLVTAHSQT
jgi:sterol desaturase/sphingolipid hydroxylase (fatty acid hydroxylase superfamily)